MTLRFEDAEGKTLEERVIELRAKHWVSLRRILLEHGVTVDVYIRYRETFRKLLIQYMTVSWPSFFRIVGFTGSLRD